MAKGAHLIIVFQIGFLDDLVLSSNFLILCVFDIRLFCVNCAVSLGLWFSRVFLFTTDDTFLRFLIL